MDIRHFIQVPPEIHTGRVLAEADQVPAKEHLAPFDLWCLFIEIVFV